MMELTDSRMLAIILYSGAIALIVIGLYAIVTRHHIIRILLGLTILEAGVNMVLVAGGFRDNAVAPIITQGESVAVAMVDPVPQALILTAIVIGVGVLALALALAVQTYKAYGTLDTRKLAEFIAQEQTHTEQAELPVQQKPAQSEDDMPKAAQGGVL
jgi:multisubunit Na+/H+ antiporter MnhC subunit